MAQKLSTPQPRRVQPLFRPPQIKMGGGQEKVREHLLRKSENFHEVHHVHYVHQMQPLYRPTKMKMGGGKEKVKKKDNNMTI